MGSLSSRMCKKLFLSSSLQDSNHWVHRRSWHSKMFGGLSITWRVLSESRRVQTFPGTAFPNRSCRNRSLCVVPQPRNQLSTHLCSWRVTYDSGISSLFAPEFNEAHDKVSKLSGTEPWGDNGKSPWLGEDELDCVLSHPTVSTEGPLMFGQFVLDRSSSVVGIRSGDCWFEPWFTWKNQDIA